MSAEHSQPFDSSIGGDPTGETAAAPTAGAQLPVVGDPTIFEQALAEGLGASYLGRTIQGQYMDALKDHLDTLIPKLRAIDPRLDLSYLAIDAYYTEPMRQVVASLSQRKNSRLSALRPARTKLLATLARKVITPDLAAQTVEASLFSEPPYLRQGDELPDDSPFVSLGCANACFRMAYSEVMREVPTERMVAQAYKSVTGEDFITNTQYLNMFHSAAIRARRGGRPIHTIHAVGVDLSRIARLVREARQKWETGKIVGIVSLASESDSLLHELMPHQVVLLGADREHVYVHDPSSTHGGPNRTIDKRTFSRRWTLGLCEALVIIAP